MQRSLHHFFKSSTVNRLCAHTLETISKGELISLSTIQAMSAIEAKQYQNAIQEKIKETGIELDNDTANFQNLHAAKVGRAETAAIAYTQIRL